MITMMTTAPTTTATSAPMRTVTVETPTNNVL